MENIIINVHEDNLSIFNEKLKGDTVAKVVDYVDPFDTLMETMASVKQSA